jgi:MFS family permease
MPALNGTRDDQPGGALPARNWPRLAGITCFSIALGMATNTLEPAVLGHRVLELLPASKNTALGLLTFAGLIVASLWQPLVGVISDRTVTRWGRRLPFMVLGTPLAIGAMYVIALAPNFGLVVVGLLSYQAAANTVQGPWQALIPDLVPTHQRGLASGMKAAFDILAFILGRQISAVLVAEGHVSGAIAVATGAYLIALTLTLFAARDERSIPPATPQGGVARTLPRAFIVRWRSHPAFVAWFINRFTFWAGFVALSTFVLFFMIDVVGLPEPEAQRFVGQMSAVLGLSLLLVTLPSGWLADRLGRRPLVAASGLIAAAGTALVLILRTPGAIIVAGGVIGLAAGTFLSANWALITDIVPETEAARYLGLANIASAGGSAVARLAGGLLIDPLNRLTGEPASGYLALYALTTVSFLLGTVAVMRLPQRPNAGDQQSGRNPSLREPGRSGPAESE